MLLSKHIQDKVEYLSAHQFKNRISVTTILNWLDNFEEDEQEIAVKILEKTEYLTMTDLSNILKGYLGKFLDKSSKFDNGLKLHMVPLGEAGKSGHVISYLVKNLFKEGKANGVKVEYYDNITKLKGTNLGESDFVIYIDDIIGSGKTFENIANKNKFLFRKEIVHRNILLSCIVMAHGKKLISEKFPNVSIWGEIREKVFDKDKSPFHSYKTILLARELAFKYGMRFKNDKTEALGFGNSHALVIFDHSTPNNSLPILWKSSKEWSPLCSRSHTQRVKYEMLDRAANNRWLFKLSNLFGIDEERFESSNLFSRENYCLALILRLRSKGWSDFDISSELGITLAEFAKLRSEGETKDLWDGEFHLSAFAIDRLDEVEKSIRFSEDEELTEPYDDCNIIYVPESFGGKS